MGASLAKEAALQQPVVTLGLLAVMLAEPARAAAALAHLQYAATDGLAGLSAEAGCLATDHWPRLKEAVQEQVVWLLGRLAALGTAGAPELLLRLLRWCGGGSRRSMWLAEQLVVVVEEHRSWVTEHPELVAGVVYCLLRQVEEHAARDTKQEVEGLARELASREAVLAVALVREAPRAAATLGRELVRALQQVARVPEVLQLWQDVLEQCLAPDLTLEALMQTSAPPKLLALRLTPVMEAKLLFLTQQVPFGQQSRYEAWFQRAHLATPESQCLRPDLVRWLVGAVHPTNEVLRSGVTPRWAVVGGLLMACTSQVASAHTKLALFFDWLSFDPSIDSIMTVEPAALLMQSTVRSHPHLLPSLLDFLLRLAPAFLPAAAAQVEASVTAAWRALVDR